MDCKNFVGDIDIDFLTAFFFKIINVGQFFFRRYVTFASFFNNLGYFK